jgi:hypothetical protein
MNHHDIVCLVHLSVGLGEGYFLCTTIAITRSSCEAQDYIILASFTQRHAEKCLSWSECQVTICNLTHWVHIGWLKICKKLGQILYQSVRQTLYWYLHLYNFSSPFPSLPFLFGWQQLPFASGSLCIWYFPKVNGGGGSNYQLIYGGISRTKTNSMSTSELYWLIDRHLPVKFSANFCE